MQVRRVRYSVSPLLKEDKAMISCRSLFGILLISTVSAATSVAAAQSDRFTVADSIEMTHFNDPSGRPLEPPTWNLSPNGQSVLIVTTKGLLPTDEVESTLWKLSVGEAEQYLNGTTSTAPHMSRLYTTKGQLRAFQTNSNGSLITNVRWAKDSRAAYLLVEQPGGVRELARVWVATRKSERISKLGYSVQDYDIDSKGVLYSAEISERPGNVKKQDVVESVRGSSIFELLWPTLRPQRSLFRVDARDTKLLISAPPYSGLGRTVFASPDATKAISLVPVGKTPEFWKEYTPSAPSGSFYHQGHSLFPVLEYQLIDLNTGAHRPLFGTPSGATSYSDRLRVVWSPRSAHALVTNTFLPLADQTPAEREARRIPCAAAYVDIRSGNASCIMFTRLSNGNNHGDPWMLSDIAFGSTDHDVVIKLLWYGRFKTECYSMGNGVWAKNPDSTCPPHDSRTEAPELKAHMQLHFELKQNLNQPPVLWAVDNSTSRRKMIWDPNPQLMNKLSAKASIYHWQASDGERWTGGLILPVGYTPGIRYPLVIQTHGFNPDEFLADGAWSTANAARPLASAGFVVLQIEDKHEQSQTMGEARIHVNGYAAAIDQLSKENLIDPKRVGIIGFSRTCWFVEQSLIESPQRFAAAVIADGVDQSYMQYMLLRPNISSMEAERYSGGKPIGSLLENWITSAPNFRLSNLQTPLRIQAIGPASLLLEWELYASLNIQDKPVDMTYLPLGQHVLQSPAELMESEQGDVDWFRYWLEGEEDLSSEKRSQYERWQELRVTPSK